MEKPELKPCPFCGRYTYFKPNSFFMMLQLLSLLLCTCTERVYVYTWDNTKQVPATQEAQP